MARPLPLLLLSSLSARLVHAQEPPPDPPVEAELPVEPPPEEAPPVEAAPDPDAELIPPTLLHDVTPEYPADARARRAQGDVFVDLTVKIDGTVDQIEVLQGPDRLLELVSVEAARGLLFTPATQGGVPVEVRIRYRFHFDLGIADQGGNAVPGSLHGKVVDPDGLALPGAKIVLEGPEGFEPRQISAKDDGRFLLGFLPSGPYRATIEAPAFSPATFDVVVEAGELVERDFTLFPVGTYEIVVSYERSTWREVERGKLEPDKGTVTGSYTLTRRDIEANPGSMEDVSRAVHSLPGIVSDGDLLATFHARGGESDEVVFLLDRVPLESPFHLAGFNSIFNPDMISSVQFYAGAAPATVPASTSAVMAVESWDGTPRQEGGGLDGALDISASSLRALAMGPVGDHLTFALAGRRSYLESYFQVMKWANLLDTAFAAPEFSELSARMAWKPTSEHRVMLSAMRAGDSLGIVNSEDESLIEVNGSFELSNTLDFFSLDHRFQPNEQWTWQTTLAYTRDRSLMIRDLAGQSDQDVITRRAFARTDLTGSLGKHEPAVGVEASYTMVGIEGEIPDTRADPTWNQAPLSDYGYGDIKISHDAAWPEASLYAQEQYNGPVRLRGGARATWSGVTDELLVSPRAGVSVPLPSGTIPKASWGIYHRIPHDPRLFDETWGNPDIKSERAQHFVVGVDQGFPLPGEDAGGMVRVEGYLVQLDHLIVSPDNQEAIDAGTTFTNDGSGQNKGVDTMVAARVNRFRGSLSLSLLWATRTNPLNTVYSQTVSPGQDQRVTLGTTLEYQLTPRWRVTTKYAFHSGRPVSSVAYTGIDDPDSGVGLMQVSCLNCDRLGPYHAIDLRAEWRKAMKRYRLVLYGEVLNVTNFQSDFLPIVTVKDGERTDSMFKHLPARPFIGVRADF